MWTSGAESSSKVSPETGIGPWMSLPRASQRLLGVKFPGPFFQKNPFSVRKICVRNSGAGNGCASFMDTWKNASVLQEKHVHKIPRFRGGVFWVFGGGGECRFYLYGRADFSDFWLVTHVHSELTEFYGKLGEFCEKTR